MKPEDITLLFIRIQSFRDQCWKAHIHKNHDTALELATLLRIAAEELEKGLA